MDEQPTPTPAAPPSVPEASTAPAPPAAPSNPTPPAALTLGQRIAAIASAAQGKGAAAEVERLTAQVSALTTERDALKAECDAAKAEAAKATAAAAVMLGQLTAAEDAVKEFEAKVIARSVDIVAQAHVPPSQLPAIHTSSGEDREASLRKRLAAATDPKEKGAICLELSSIRSWNN